MRVCTSLFLLDLDRKYTMLFLSGVICHSQGCPDKLERWYHRVISGIYEIYHRKGEWLVHNLLCKILENTKRMPDNSAKRVELFLIKNEQRHGLKWDTATATLTEHL